MLLVNISKVLTFLFTELNGKMWSCFMQMYILASVLVGDQHVFKPCYILWLKLLPNEQLMLSIFLLSIILLYFGIVSIKCETFLTAWEDFAHFIDLKGNWKSHNQTFYFPLFELLLTYQTCISSFLAYVFVEFHYN